MTQKLGLLLSIEDLLKLSAVSEGSFINNDVKALETKFYTIK